MESLTNWRLLMTGHNDAGRNMAVDEAVLRSYVQGVIPPTLRIYGWQPPSLSIGYFQDPVRELDLAECKKRSIGFVRRITAGGIVFHAEELTYSMVCSHQHLRSGRSIENSFKRICSFIIRAYQALGLEAGFAIDQAEGIKNLGGKTAFCFSGREKYDILINGRKIGGNAQRRFHNIIFQHGSIPLRGEVGFAASLLREKPRHLEQRVTTLAEALGRPIEFDEFAAELVKSFKQTSSPELSKGDLSGQENDLAEYLNREKYSRPEWNIFRSCPLKADEDSFKKTVLA